MKPQNNRLPVMIGVSAALCIIITVLSFMVINYTDNSMIQDKIDETKPFMRQAAASVQKDFDSKSESVSDAALSLSGSQNSLKKLLKEKSKEFKKLTQKSQFERLLLSDTKGNAYDADGNKYAVGKLDFFAEALKGKTGISRKAYADLFDDGIPAIVYYAPVTGEDGNVAILMGFAPAHPAMDGFTDSPASGWYILDHSGALVMSSDTANGGSFYSTIKGNRLASGQGYHCTDSYLPGSEKEEEHSTEPPKTVTDHYAVELTDSRSLLSMMHRNDNVSRTYFYRELDINGWKLFIVRTVQLSDSTVSFIILSRVLLVSIAVIFFAAMLVTMLLQWKNSQKITSLAYVDDITGCANWHKFIDVCNHRLAHKSWWRSRHALLCIDINRFTIYNDYYGHKAGNRLLKFLAETLEQMCSSREMSARRGRDVFVALWNYSSVEELNNRIEALFRQVQESPNSKNVSLTVGVYLLTDQDTDIIHAVDMALIAERTIADVKVNTVAYFDDKLRAQMTEEHELEKMMHSALENDEFKLYIQPKHRVQDGALGGAEALVRWISPKKGFISPGRFIPLFEKNGFVGPVDNYILEQLCIFQRNRLRKGYKTIPISVNVSRVQLSDPNLVDEICAIVDKHSVPHKYIDIELTESACFDDMEVLVSTITKLRSMGFPVSMDDFGSGYSSLNLLKDLPFDTLKIDGEFFRNVTDPNRANIVVMNIIDLAKSLNMTVVAEGIEQQEQVDFLRKTECDLIQGYFYSKPIPAKEFEQYMANHRIENK